MSERLISILRWRQPGGALRACGAWAALTCAIALLFGATAPAAEEDFTQKLARVDAGLKHNPAGVPMPMLDACRNRRNFAVLQLRARQATRAERSLKFCFDLLKIPQTGPLPGEVVEPEGPTQAQMKAAAAAELEKAMKLEPNIARGRAIYADCAMCHEPEGWGLVAGSTPQIAGQHRSVLIKQLADIRAGTRETYLMFPYASVDAIGGTQAVADVTGYIDSLEMTIENGKGSGEQLDLGQRLYAENCQDCHGASAEGNAADFVPRLHAQHYNYLVRQFERIKSGKRHNADAEMVKQIEKFSDRDTQAVLDYISRLQPPVELQAPPGWHNPDFPRRARYEP